MIVYITVVMYVRDCLIYVNDTGRPSLLWVKPFPRQREGPELYKSGKRE